MSFAEEAHEWPAYDGLGDEQDSELPVQEADDDEPSLEELERWLRDHPSGLGYFDQFVQQALFWVHEEMPTELAMLELKNVRTALKQDFGPKLKSFLSVPLLRLKLAIESDDWPMALQTLMKLTDIMRARPAPAAKPYWAPKI